MQDIAPDAVQLALESRDWDRLASLARDLQRVQRWQEAEHCLQQVLAYQPEHYRAQLALIEQFLVGGRNDEAHTLAECALALKPEDPQLLIGYGRACAARGDTEDALTAFESAESQKGPWQALAGKLFVMNLGYLPDVTAQDIIECASRWEERYAPVAPKRTPSPRRAGQLRIGYYSPDFRSHSISHFLLPILEGHDHQAFALYLYSDTLFNDPVTARYRALADHWRDLTRLSVAQAVELIRQDNLDLLIDCAGFFGACRPEIFARRPAPVQAHLIGYNGTTGLHSLDYRFSDALCEPAGTESDSTETLVRLEPGFHCYRPNFDAPAPEPPPFLSKGCITFGSFNNIAKINDEVVALWCRAMNAVPRSRLLVKAIGLGNSDSRERLRARFSAQGIAAERIEILPGTASLEAHLKTYHRVDIALDTFPVNGTTTTLEGLWMGVPILTLQGQRHSARVSASLLSQVGLQACIATDEDAFVAAAKALAADGERLIAWRTQLRRKIQTSPLGDASQFVPRLEAAYRELVAPSA
jgi:predicted O-linked N-acetylglucosamine transferase (SPINDLY family)